MLRFSEKKSPLLHVMTQDTSLNKDINVHTNVHGVPGINNNIYSFIITF